MANRSTKPLFFHRPQQVIPLLLQEMKGLRAQADAGRAQMAELQAQAAADRVRIAALEQQLAAQ